MTCANHRWISDPGCLACTVRKQGGEARQNAAHAQSQVEALSTQHASQLAALERRRAEEQHELSRQQNDHASATRAFERTMWESNTLEGQYFKKWRQWVEPWVSFAEARETEWKAATRTLIDQAIRSELHTRQAESYRKKKIGAAIGAAVSLVIALVPSFLVLQLLGFFAFPFLALTALLLWFLQPREEAKGRKAVIAIRETTFPSWSYSEILSDTPPISQLIAWTRRDLRAHAHEVDVEKLTRQFPYVCMALETENFEQKYPELPAVFVQMIQQFRADDRAPEEFPPFEPVN